MIYEQCAHKQLTNIAIFVFMFDYTCIDLFLRYYAFGYDNNFMTKRELNFFKYRNFAYIVSTIFIIIAMIVLLLRGLNYGIDFKGGVIFEIRTYNHDISDIRHALDDLGFESFQVQTLGDMSNDYLIKLKLEEEMTTGFANIEEIKNQIFEALNDDVVFRKTDFVGPKIGLELVKKSLIAVFLSLFGILGYVGFRFDFKMGISAIIALIHDVFLIFCFYVITQLEFNTSSIAVMLIILGYSINDTVVVFDRVRENKRKHHYTSIIPLINQSVSQTLRRTIITSFTTLIVTVAIALFGGPGLRDFSYALCFGIVIGTYSTIFIASSLYAIFCDRDIS